MGNQSEWFIVGDRDGDFPNPGEQVLVVFLPHRRGKRRSIRTAVYFRFDEWFVHGGDDAGYYDHSFIERWAQQPDLPAPKD